MTALVGAFVEAWEEIRIHRLRVILSLTGVAIAIATMTAVTAVGQQMAQASSEMTESWAGRNVTLTVNAFPGDFNDSEKVVTALSEFPDRYDIAYSSRVVWSYGTFSTVGGNFDSELRVIDADYAVIHRLATVQGEWFGDGDSQRLAPALVVNEAFLDSAGVPTDLSVQPEVVAQDGTNQSYVVIGVLPNTYEGEMPAAFVLYDSWRQAVGEDTADSQLPALEMWVPPGAEQQATEQARSELASVVGEQGSVDVQSSNMTGGEDYTAGMRQVILGIAVAVLILGGIALINMSLVTVQQRVREIGIRRSFGASSWRVFFAIMMESIVATFLAGIAGVMLAILTLNYLPLLSMMGMPVQDSPPFPMGTAVQGILAATAIGAVAGLLPGLVAMRIKPIEAMRA